MHMLVANLLSGAFSDTHSDAKFNAIELQPRIPNPPSKVCATIGFNYTSLPIQQTEDLCW